MNSVVDVWRGFANLAVTPVEPIAAPMPEPFDSACVTVRSSWYGALVIVCPQTLLDRAARQSLRVNTPDTGDRNAVIGECANMIAYCLKPYCVSDTEFSLPVVANGTHPVLSLPGAARALIQCFRADDGTPFEVSVVVMGDA